MKRRISSIALLSLLVIALAIMPVLALTVSAEGSDTWTLVTDASTLKAGDTLLIATNAKNAVAGDISNSVMASVGFTFSTDKSTLTNVPSGAVMLTLGGNAGAWTFANSSGKLLGATAVKKLAWGSGTTAWSITIDNNGDATIQNNTSSYGRMLYNASSPRFTTYTSATNANMLLPQIYRLETSVCKHPNTTIDTKPATCTETGTKTTICSDCGEILGEEVIEALGHNYVDGICTGCGEELVTYNATFVAPGGYNEVKQGVLKEGALVTTMPDAVEASDTKYTFVGWAASEVAGTTIEPTLYQPGEDVELNKDTKFYAVYSYVSTVKETGYVKKDLADIAATDVVVIIASKGSSNWALSNENGTVSAPAAVAVTVIDKALSGEIAANLKWNISNSDGDLTIYPNGTTATWLYCTSSNNGVRVGTNDANVFTMDGSGYLKHTGTNRYLGVYTANPDWRCYTSTTTNIQDQTFSFFVESDVDVNVTSYTTNVETEIKGAQLQIDDSLAIKYYVKLADGIDTNLLKMKFTLADNDETAKIVDTFEIVDDRYVFIYKGIAPQSMADNVKAELIYGEDEVIATLDNYSVKQYAANMIIEHSDNENLVKLLSAMLHYGAAAQEYLDYNLDNLANVGVDNILPVENGDFVNDGLRGKPTDNGGEDLVFKAAGVRFDYNNKVYLRFVAADIDNVVVKIYKDDVLVVDNAEVVVSDGICSVYSDGISANDFDAKYSFEVYYNGEVVLVVNYSVNSYAYVKSTSDNTEMAALAKAMYFYGAAAEAYEA